MQKIKNTYLAAIVAFLYAPIVVLIAQSFNASRYRGQWTGFTWEWYEKLIESEDIINAFSNTLTIGVTSAILATLLALVTALGMRQMGRQSRMLLRGLANVPLLNADIVTGISLMLLFIFAGMKLGFGSLLLSHVIFNVPYVILTVLPKLRQFDQHLYEAALDLGASPAYAFRHIVLPEILPGIVTGALFAFTLSVDDFVISFFTTGSGVNNLSILIYSMARRGIHPTINALSTLLFLTVLVLLIAVNLRMEKKVKREARR